MLRLTLISALFALPFLGCSLIHDTPATKGATYTRQTWREEVLPPDSSPNTKPLPRERTVETFTQGENPSSRSTFEKSLDGSISMILGTGRANESIIPPPPDYTKYIGLIVSLLFLGGGIYLLSNGSPRLGSRLSIAGVAGSIVSMTIDQFGIFYAIGILLFGGFLAYENHRAYQKGLHTPVPPSTDATK